MYKMDKKDQVDKIYKRTKCTSGQVDILYIRQEYITGKREKGPMDRNDKKETKK